MGAQINPSLAIDYCNAHINEKKLEWMELHDREVQATAVAGELGTALREEDKEKCR